MRATTIEALAGHAGGAYVSPPQDRRQAFELIAVLLGHPAAPDGDGTDTWRQAIAGGQRA